MTIRRTRAVLPFLIMLLASTVHAQRLTLLEALRSADDNNPRIRAAAAAVDAEKGRKLSALSPESPRLTYHEEEIPSGSGLGAGAQRYYQISQAFDIPLLTGARSGMYSAFERAAEQRLESVRRSIRASVIASYADLATFVAQAGILREEVDALEELAAAALKREIAGDVTHLAVLRARAETSVAAAELLHKEGQILVAESELAAALGLETEIPRGKLDSLPASPVGDHLAIDLEALTRAHPEARSARFISSGMRAELTNRRLSAFPAFEAAWFRQEIAGVGWFWGAELGARIPLWFFLAENGRIQEASADARRAEYEAEHEVALVRKRMLGAMAALSNAADILRLASGVRQEEAAEISRTARRSFELGQISIVELLDGLRTARAARLDRLEALRIYYRALAEYEYATNIKLLEG